MAKTNRKKVISIDSRYDLLAYETMSGKHKTCLGNKNDRLCRYCGKRSPEVKFRNEAHAFPQAIGNRWIIDYWECDTCNALFSRMLEDDFVKYLGPQRTLSRIRGTNGIPSFQRKKGELRIEWNGDTLKITTPNENSDVVIDEDGKGFTLRVKLQPYTPMGVFKCFVKMALAVMPEAELKFCKHLIKWISEKQHSTESFPFSPLLIFTQFMPFHMPNDVIIYSLQKRKEGITNVPFMQFTILIHNTHYQFFLPMPEQDRGNIVNDMTNQSCLEQNGIELGKEDFTSHLVVRDDIRIIRMGPAIAPKFT